MAPQRRLIDRRLGGGGLPPCVKRWGARLGLLLAAALAAAAPARAQTFGNFQFADTAGAPLSALTIANPGGTADVRVYLVETDGQNTLNTIGLFSADVRVRYDNPAGVANVLSVNDIMRNPQFDQQLGTSRTDTFAILNEQTTSLAGVQSPANDPNRVYLGTFHFTGQNLGTVTVTADSPVATGGTLLNNGTDLSNRITAGTLSLTVIPEPGWLLLGLVAAGLAARRRRAAAGRR